MPRAGLTEARVVAEAELLADDVGLSKLTLAALADRLGVRQPSLYKHVAGMEGLQRSIALRAKHGKAALKFIPHQPVLFGGAFESPDAARPLHRVERREIAEFHRQAV